MWQRHVAVTTIDDVRLGPFQVEFSEGAAGREDEFRLRWDVFVSERKFLNVESPERLERDEFDDRSAALLLRDADTGEPAACQRFILPDRLAASLPTQVEQLAAIFGVPFDPAPRTAWAEVSRSTIAPHYRWGAGTSRMPAMLAIKYASLALARALGRDTLFSVSDVRTARLTRRMGFRLQQIGDVFEYHGPRALFRIDMCDVQRSVPAHMHDVVQALTAHARALTTS